MTLNWRSKPVNYVLMSAVLFSWGYEYIAAKNVLDDIKPLTLVFFKYGIAFVIMLIVKWIRISLLKPEGGETKRVRLLPIKVKDIPFYFLCSIFGQVLYNVGQFGAMETLPVATVTILLSFVPMLAILVEWVFFKRRPTVGVIIGIVICIAGVSLVVGGDIGLVLGRSAKGYLLATMAIVSWCIYNFATARLSDSYSSYDLTMLQLIATSVLSMPYALTHLPKAAAVDAPFVFSVGYLVVFSAFLGFMVYVNAVGSIGVTPTTIFANMMPVTSTFFGWLFLGEMIRPVQVIGGIIVIASGSVVIRLKGREQV